MVSYAKLGVNIDHIATIRQIRGTKYPDPIQAAFIAEQYGADSITVHLREDRRHINDRDVFLLRKTIQTNMNLEMSISDEMVDFACELKPNFCCLVPENSGEMTTEHGLDVVNNKDRLHQIVVKLRNFGIESSLFIDADEKQILAAIDIGVNFIEINSRIYSECYSDNDRMLEFKRINRVVYYAADRGLVVNVGHGLDYLNVELIASLSLINELNIGHSIISRAFFCGLSQAVQDMKKLLIRARKE